MNGQVKPGEKCPYCGRYFDRYVACEGIIVRDGKVLMIKRNGEPDKGKWALIGGYLDWNETVEEAVVREVKEEVGLTTKVRTLLGVYSNPDRDHGLQNVAIVFSLDLLSEDIKAKETEVQAVQWFPLEDLPDEIAFNHRDVIHDYLRKAP